MITAFGAALGEPGLSANNAQLVPMVSEYQTEAFTRDSIAERVQRSNSESETDTPQETVQVWRLGLQRWDFAPNCTGHGDGPCEPEWKSKTPSDWRVHGLWPGPSPPSPEKLDCDPSSALDTSESSLTSSIGSHLYERMLKSWAAQNMPQMASNNIFKEVGALSTLPEDIWKHEWFYTSCFDS